MPVREGSSVRHSCDRKLAKPVSLPAYRLELANRATTTGVMALRRSQRESGSSPRSTLIWRAAVWRIIRTPDGPMESKYSVMRTYRSRRSCSGTVAMSLYGSTPRATSVTPDAIISRSMVPATRRTASISCVAVACGALLISICPPGSNEMRAPSLSVHEGGSSSVRCSVQPSRAASRESTAAVDLVPSRADTTFRVTESTGISSSSAPTVRGDAERVGENSRCRTSSISIASVSVTEPGQLLERASASAKDPSSAGSHLSSTSPDA